MLFIEYLVIHVEIQIWGALIDKVLEIHSTTCRDRILRT